jgi:hypothetical protein
MCQAGPDIPTDTQNGDQNKMYPASHHFARKSRVETWYLLYGGHIDCSQFRRVLQKNVNDTQMIIY